MISGVFALFWLLIMIITWIMGLWQMRQVTQFLASDRPLLRWTYTLPEWEAIKQARQQEDARQLENCLWLPDTSSLPLTGLLTGLLIGLDEGTVEGILGALAGTVIGGGIGAALGMVVGGGNALAAWRAYREAQPEQVALGASEIYANESYFKSNGSYRSHSPGTPGDWCPYIADRGHMEPQNPRQCGGNLGNRRAVADVQCSRGHLATHHRI